MKNDNSKHQDEKVSVGKWIDQKRPVRRHFDGPAGIDIPLRISFNKKAYAEIVAHSKESLDAEICGVLIGEVCEDDEGLFVQIQAAVRGQEARQEKAHVTFTQQTWEMIHKQKEEKYPKLQILGWYHSHPGFGVKASEMDRFIHKNFFSSETQFGIIVDPLSGDVTAFINSADGIQYLNRFWVHSKEHKCNIPERKTADDKLESSPMLPELLEAIEKVNTRLSHVVQSLDDFHNLFLKFLTVLGFIFCLGFISIVAYHIYSSYTSKLKPPELVQYVNIPVQIGNKTVMLGIAVVDWQIPEELNSIYLQLEQAKREREKQEAQKKATEDTKTEQVGKKTKDIRHENKSLLKKPE